MGGLSFPISSMLTAVIGKTLPESDLPLITPVGILLWLSSYLWSTVLRQPVMLPV